jgi:hypothetical protein
MKIITALVCSLLASGCDYKPDVKITGPSPESVNKQYAQQAEDARKKRMLNVANAILSEGEPPKAQSESMPGYGYFMKPEDRPKDGFKQEPMTPEKLKLAEQFFKPRLDSKTQ